MSALKTHHESFTLVPEHQPALKHAVRCSIYSFDGGSKETYEKMRPGRFKKNSFEKVYENIKKFSEIRKKLNSKFPVTKIQMILTRDSRDEVENFFALFKPIVDEVTITQYNERGGNLEDLSINEKKIVNAYLEENKLPKDTPFMVDFEGNIFISKNRKPCEQIFQFPPDNHAPYPKNLYLPPN